MMSQQTPTPTPLRVSRRQILDSPQKPLPLIVDIALDKDGKQLYQVHESSKMVRKEMPRSNNFVNNEEDDGDRTPVRKVLGTISPLTLNKKSDGEEEEPVSATRKSHSASESHGAVLGDLSLGLNLKGLNLALAFDSFTDDHEDPGAHGPLDDNPSSATSTISALSFSRPDNDIWSEDVEHAFEEVLSIIPKNGLNKIKISGRSCGRNELISDYILTKTGKFRTRKQVSSHIQVIKNLGQKLDIIKLINDGPVFSSNEEQTRKNKRFEEIFSKINLDKSMGFSESSTMNTNAAAQSLINRKHSLAPATYPSKRPMLHLLDSPASIISKARFENFFMSIYDSYSLNPIILSIQNNSEVIKSLKLKDDANISSRFPGLNDFQNSTVPIIHNMVKITFPTLPFNYSIDNGFKSNFLLNCMSSSNSPEYASVVEETYTSFICVYSYGKEVVKFNENDFKLNENQSFLPKFWKFFFSKLVGKDDSETALAFKGMTIKQIIYDSDNTEEIEQNPSANPASANMISKLKIRLVLLWEFGKVEDFKEAITTTTKLVLPTKLATSEDIVPQVLDYHKPSLSEHSTVTLSPSSSLYANNVLMPSTLLLATPGNSAVPPSALPQNSPVQSSNPMDPSWVQPQVNLQRKFQSLQQTVPQVNALPLAQNQAHQHQQQYVQYAYLQAIPTQSAPPLQPISSIPAPPSSEFPPPANSYPSQLHPSVNMDLMMMSGDSQDFQMQPMFYGDSFVNEFN
jgi:transcriptional enhancer factor